MVSSRCYLQVSLVTWLARVTAAREVPGSDPRCRQFFCSLYEALGTGCTPFLHCLGILSLYPPCNGKNKYQPHGWLY